MKTMKLRFIFGVCVASLVLIALSVQSSVSWAAPRADPQMQAVLDQLMKWGAKPLETLTPQQARTQPSPADAVKAVLKAQGKSTAPESVGRVANQTVRGPGGTIPIRIYTPAGSGPFPVVLFIHGGGWVIANLDTYDASARALTNAATAVVVSTHYRQAPEHKFPAAHDDTWTVYQWVLANAKGLNGDPKRIAVAGESAGGNMAASIAMMARDGNIQMPAHQLLVYPVANYAFDTASYDENADAKPLSRPAMQWFFEHYLKSPDDGDKPRLSILRASHFNNLPSTTIILAQIDPLRSEGEMYAGKLKGAGVPVVLQTFDGVTHEFFGMAAVVDKAKQAQQLAGQNLKAAFASVK